MARARVGGKTSTEKGGAARGRIVAAARRHFFANGFRGITMDDLASELGMSKKTLYACFESKTALLRAVMLNKVRDIEAAFDGIARERPPEFMGELQRLLACVQHHTEEIRPPFIRDLQRDAPELFTLIEARRRALLHRHFKKLLDRGRKAGTIRRDIPMTLIIEILLGATEAIVRPQKMVELGLTPDTAFAAVVHLMLEGAMVRTGRGKI